MQQTKLVVENVCPRCESSACAQFVSIDGKEVHLTCLDCNKVYASKVEPSGDLRLRRWREIGNFARL